MRIVIFANGLMENHAVAVQPGDVIVAADGGTRHTLAAGLTPAHVIGDLDSVPAEVRAHLETAGTVFHVHPPTKDETDLELALLWAAAQGADEIVVLGALGGRPDQALANLLLLALPALEGHAVLVRDGDWEIRLLRGGETLRLRGHHGDTLSLLPLGGDAEGVTTRGLAYSLHDETLHCGPARGVSNVFAGEEAFVQVTSGWLWCFHQVKG